MNDHEMIASLVKIDGSGEREIDRNQYWNCYDALELMEDYAMEHAEDDEDVAEKWAEFASGQAEKDKEHHADILEKNGEIHERFIEGGYDIELRVYFRDYSDGHGL